jgi:hypothetical protein
VRSAISAFSTPNTDNAVRRTIDRLVDAGEFVHPLGLRLIHEDIRHDERADLQPAVEKPVLGEELQDVAAEAADRAFFDGDQHLMLAGKPAIRSRRAAWRSAHRPRSWTSP